MAAFEQRLDSFFHITERGSTLRTELKAGFIMFLTMFYILAANPHIISTAPPSIMFSMSGHGQGRWEALR